MTIKEVMAEFNIKSDTTVMMQVYKEGINARKADSEEGDAGGIWLISRESANAKWGYRTKNGNV